MRTEEAEKIIRINKDSYDRMAEEFSRTRSQFWKELEFLAEHALPGMRVLDIGCGNGRLYPVLEERAIEYTGLDNSRGLLLEAKEMYPEVTFVEGSATELPFPNQSFDIAFSFATLHHIPSRALRAKFVREAARVLKPGNTFILTVWDLWQKEHLPKIFLESLKSLVGLSELEIGDLWLTFGKERHKRFLHAFTHRELTKLLSKNGFEVVGSEIVERASGSGNKNILIVAKKR